MRVLMLAPEAHPYAKTGGLADVLSALPRALGRAGAEVTVCLPGYRSARQAAGALRAGGRVRAPVGSRMEPAELLHVAESAVPTVLVGHDGYFDRDGLYGSAAGDYADNAERFVFFCRAALEWLRTLDPPPDVLHVHEWQAALAPAFLAATAPLYPELTRSRTVMTVHNLAYQGRFPEHHWSLLNLDGRYFSPDFLEFYGQINFLKAGLVFADAVTTVSPRYAREIATPAFGEGLDGVIRARATSLHGILNGIDDVEWNPASDRHLPAHFDARDTAGKARCKVALQAEVGLPVRAATPLLAVVSRFAEQKGLDLLVAALPALLAGSDASLVVLGSGDARYETLLAARARDFPGRAAVHVGFDEALAHRIEAGADVFLMPSRFEPCGLNQLYSLRYGTVPVVHATGGLDDTVVEFDPERGTGTGFKFDVFGVEPFLAATRRALAVYADRPRWAQLVRNGMAQDFSWNRSAQAYLALYESLASGAAPPAG
jgi:starch synthase